jgi:hypothetical protein
VSAGEWKYQTTDRPDLDHVVTRLGASTDAAGLRALASAGFGWVDMGSGWVSISSAIRTLEGRESRVKSGRRIP